MDFAEIKAKTNPSTINPSPIQDNQKLSQANANLPVDPASNALDLNSPAKADSRPNNLKILLSLIILGFIGFIFVFSRKKNRSDI